MLSDNEDDEDVEAVLINCCNISMAGIFEVNWIRLGNDDCNEEIAAAIVIIS